MERALGAMTIDRASTDPALLKTLFGMDLRVQFSPPSLPKTADEALKPLTDLVRNVLPAFNRFIYYPVWNFAWKDQDKLHLMQHWQAGRLGSLRMGIAHGGWCIGCCWALMAALFALGVMSLGWMAFIAALIAIEKLLPWKSVANRGIAVLLLVLGLAIAFAPESVPGLTVPGSAEAMQGMNDESMGGGMSQGSMNDRSMGGTNQGSMEPGSMDGGGTMNGGSAAGAMP